MFNAEERQAVKEDVAGRGWGWGCGWGWGGG